MNLDLGSLFSRAWKITWNNKILWLFGVFAALGRGAGNGNPGGNSNYRTSGPSNFPSGQPGLPPEVGRWFNDVQNAAPTIITIVIGVICVAILIGLAIYVLSLLGQGGLIGGARLADSQGHVTFGEAWQLARRNVWRLFLVNLPLLLLGILIALIAFVAAIAFLGALATGGDSRSLAGGLGVLLVCGIPLICILALGALLLKILIFFARFGVVLEDLAPMAAFRRAWQVLIANLGSIVVLGIILIIAGAVFGFLVALPLIIVVLPVILGGLGTAVTGQAISLAAGGIFALVCCAAYFPVLLVLQGVYETWATSTWTLAWLQLTGARPAVPVAPYPVSPGGTTT